MTTPSRFRLEHNGADWCGTFQVVLAAALDSFLEDGEPIAVTFTLPLQPFAEAHTVEALVIRREGQLAILDVGVPINLHDVLAMEVS